MADNRYTPKVYRKLGGSAFVVASSGEINVESGGTVDLESGGTLHYEQGGYSYTDAVVAHSTALSPLIIGAINKASSTGTTGMSFLLPTPVVGAEIWFYTTDGTSGKFHVCSGTGTTAIDRVISTSTEAGLSAAQNNIITCTGVWLGFKAISSSEWALTSNVGAAVASTAVGTTA